MSEDSCKAKFLSMFVAMIARGCCHRQSQKVLRHNHGLLSGMQASSTVDSGGRFINISMHAGHGPVHMFLRNRRISGVLGAIPSQLLPAGISREIACKPYALNCKDFEVLPRGFENNLARLPGFRSRSPTTTLCYLHLT